MTEYVDGFYWTSHDLGWWLPEGKRFPETPQVVEIANGELWQCGADIGVYVADIPDYVKLVGPLSPPEEFKS